MLLASILVRCEWQLLDPPLTLPSGSVWRCEGLGAAGHGPSDLRAQCAGADRHPNLQATGCRWVTRVHVDQFALFFICTLPGKSFIVYVCVCVKSLFQSWRSSIVHWPQTRWRQRSRNWKPSALVTERVWRRSSLPPITSHQRRRRRSGFDLRRERLGHFVDSLSLSFVLFDTQVYKEREVYVKEWRKRKRLVTWSFKNRS